MLLRSVTHVRYRVRGLATRHALYHQKVAAWPFAMSKQDAIVQLGPLASLFCLGKGMVGSLASFIFPGLSPFSPLQPAEIKPVYFPGWFVNAAMEAEIIDSSTGTDRKQRVTPLSSNSYIPGISYKWLSDVSFRTNGRRATPVTFTEDMKTQMGEEVICLPYTLSPLPLMEYAHSLSYSDSQIDDNLRVTPSSLKINLFSAYPILVPLYLARYEFEAQGEPFNVTAICDASVPRGHVAIEQNQDDMLKVTGMTLPKWLDIGNLDRDFVSATGKESPQPNIVFSNSQRGLQEPVQSWLEGMVFDSRKWRKLVHNDGPAPDFEDLRIRQWTQNERESMHTYFRLNKEIANTKDMMEALASIPGTIEDGAKVTVIGKSPGVTTNDAIGGVVEALQKQLAEVETARDAAIPQWWKDWQASQDADKNKATSS